ncbi:unnamed protein product [Tenebrio molitor]|nr:unnamed protein product [Tenebrio molitor]
MESVVNRITILNSFPSRASSERRNGHNIEGLVLFSPRVNSSRFFYCAKICSKN